jgi:regulatory protein
MKITAIKQQLKKQGRYSLYVEGKYAFSLSADALLDSRLIVGQELTDDKLRELKQQSDDDKAYNNSLAYAMLRPRSAWEMEQYLRRKKVSPALAETILNKLSMNGMVDDEKFARSWVANRRLLKPTSRRRLSQELRAKRVPGAIAEKVLAEDDTDETELLIGLIGRKRKQARYQDDEKLLQYLSGQGYSYGDIKAALETAADAED